MALRLRKSEAKKLIGVDGQCDRAAVPGRGMNKLETRFSEQLEGWKYTGQVWEWRYNSVRVKLANGAWFKCDFVAQVSRSLIREIGLETGDGRELVFFETKGFMRESANVRIKVAADRYPFFRFVVVRLVHGEWAFKEIRP